MRPAGADDLDQLVALERACFARPWTRAAWAAELAPRRDRACILLAGEPPLAFVCAAMLGELCELRRIAVHPSARWRGLAGRLLDELFDRAEAAGCRRVELEVAASNEAALSLYDAAGFVVVGRRRGYYRAPPDDAILLDRPLG